MSARPLRAIRATDRRVAGRAFFRAGGWTRTADRGPRFLAQGLWAGIVILSLGEAAMIFVTLRATVAGQWGFRGNEALLALGWGSIGALIAVRKPENRIGWLLLALSLVSASQGVVDQYPALAEALRLDGGEAAGWVSAWIWVIPSVGFLAFVPLIFPDGRLPSRRWRGAVVLGAAAMAVFVGTIVLSIRPLGPLAPSPNVNPSLQASAPTALAFGLYVASAVAGVGSILLRYRHAGGEARRQLKWVAYALVLVVIGAIAGTSPNVVGQLFFLATVMLAGVAVGIAILRYRLYEIDLIINRTLVYGTLTAILAGIYTASISLSQRLFMAVTGERSDAAIVVTTLILVATFTPLHTRLQGIVDRRVKPVSSPANVTSGAIDATAVLDAAEERLRKVAREEVARSTGPLASRPGRDHDTGRRRGRLYAEPRLRQYACPRRLRLADIVAGDGASSPPLARRFAGRLMEDHAVSRSQQTHPRAQTGASRPVDPSVDADLGLRPRWNSPGQL